ncbi:hypothetical protein AWC38_SpisGene3772 [Stylophora pistillata]|uniref:C-type lectin domain-containing protein n=1 Tax=Stylophora pistillata TaxID=50429 RepID=A0A2B4SQN5_STYPI|nr:hypothetical protein AWC38_SpisGene3772 [Stylophora pistillata]
MRVADCDTTNGWKKFDVSCYKFFGETDTWKHAKNHCQNINFILVTNHSTEEDNFVSFLIPDDETGAWIGANDRSSDGSGRKNPPRVCKLVRSENDNDNDNDNDDDDDDDDDDNDDDDNDDDHDHEYDNDNDNDDDDDDDDDNDDDHDHDYDDDNDNDDDDDDDDNDDDDDDNDHDNDK